MPAKYTGKNSYTDKLEAKIAELDRLKALEKEVILVEDPLLLEEGE
jgi:hypothetical protein